MCEFLLFQTYFRKKKRVFSSSIPCGKYNKNPDDKLFKKHNRFFFNGKIPVLESNCHLALISILQIKCYKMMCLFTCSRIVFLGKLFQIG